MKTVVLLCTALLSTQLDAQPPRLVTDVTLRMTVDSGGGRVVETVMRMRANGKGVLRSDFTSTSAPGMAGGYSLMFEAADSMITVVPSSNMVVVGHAPAAMMKAMGSFKMTAREQDATARDDGAGPTLLGLPTHKFHVTTHAVVDVAIGTSTCAKTYDVVHDMLSAAGAKMPMDAQGLGFGAGMSGADPKLLAAMQAKIPAGVPMHDESTTGSVRTVLDVTAISFEPQDASVFALPPAIPVTDTRAMMAANAAMMQPMMEAQFKKAFCGT